MVSTRSGRSLSAARDQEEVPAALPATRRTSRAKKVSDPIPEPEPAPKEPQYEDIPAAAAFQASSPVKSLTPRAPKSPAKSPATRSPATRDVSTRDNNKGLSDLGMPTPRQRQQASELAEAHAAALPEEMVVDEDVIATVTPAPRSSRRQSRAPPTPAAAATAASTAGPSLSVLIPAVLTFTLLLTLIGSVAVCTGQVSQLSSATSLPYCRQVRTLWDITQQRCSAAQMYTQQQYTAVKAQAALHTEQARASGHVWLQQGLNQVKDLIEQVKGKWADVVALVKQRLAPLPPPLPQFWHSALHLESLQALNTTGALDLEDLYRTSLNQAARQYKPTGLLLTCQSAEDCQSAANKLGAAVSPAANFLHVDSSKLVSVASSDAPGRLQQQLATQLSSAPNSIILISDLQELTPGCFAVLNNALSESGSLHAAGGRSVRTAGSLFILQLQQHTRKGSGGKGAAVEGADSSTSVEEQEFTAKDDLQLMIASSAQGGLADTTLPALALALRRRIDAVLHYPHTVIVPPTPEAPVAVDSSSTDGSGAETDVDGSAAVRSAEEQQDDTPASPQ